MIALAAAAVASSLAVWPPAMTVSTDGGGVVVSLRAEETEAKFRVRYGGCSCVTHEPGTEEGSAGILVLGGAAASFWYRRRRHAS